MGSRKKKKKRSANAAPAPAMLRPAARPDSLWIRLVCIVLTVAFFAGAVLGLREIVGALITGEICSSDDCYGWSTEPGGYIGELLFTAFLTLCAGCAVAGGWDGLHNGIEQVATRQRKEARDRQGPQG